MSGFSDLYSTFRRNLLDTYEAAFKRKALFRRVFGTPDGERVLTIMLQMAKTKEPPFDTDPLKMAAKCGRQEFALMVLNLINMPDDVVSRLEQEVMDD